MWATFNWRFRVVHKTHRSDSRYCPMDNWSSSSCGGWCSCGTHLPPRKVWQYSVWRWKGWDKGFLRDIPELVLLAWYASRETHTNAAIFLCFQKLLTEFRLCRVFTRWGVVHLGLILTIFVVLVKKDIRTLTNLFNVSYAEVREVSVVGLCLLDMLSVIPSGTQHLGPNRHLPKSWNIEMSSRRKVGPVEM